MMNQALITISCVIIWDIVRIPLQALVTKWFLKKNRGEISGFKQRTSTLRKRC